MYIEDMQTTKQKPPPPPAKEGRKTIQIAKDNQRCIHCLKEFPNNKKAIYHIMSPPLCLFRGPQDIVEQ